MWSSKENRLRSRKPVSRCPSIHLDKKKASTYLVDPANAAKNFVAAILGGRHAPFR